MDDIVPLVRDQSKIALFDENMLQVSNWVTPKPLQYGGWDTICLQFDDVIIKYGLFVYYYVVWNGNDLMRRVLLDVPVRISEGNVPIKLSISL